jgi:LPXTG-site transpeptidase (sortase) family protein
VDAAPPLSVWDGGGAVSPARAQGDRRTRLLVVAGVVLLLAAAIAGVVVWTNDGPVPVAVTTTASAAAPPPATLAAPVARKPAAPVRPLAVSIPAIGVTSSLVPLKLDRAGALQPPDDFVHAGWYVGAPTPGDQGPAVIAGHVDSRKGPAIFFRLRDLKPGDQVIVTRSDHRTARFKVVEVQRYPKNAFPAARVYMPTPDAALRLITCGGSFDYARRSYRDNIVVYAVAI